MKLKNRTDWLFYLFLLIAISVIFYPALKNPALYLDDYQNIYSFKLIDTSISLKGMWQALTYNLAGIRPLSYLTIYLTNTLFGPRILFFLIFNLTVHFINAVLFYKIAYKLTENKEIAYVTAFLWAISPVNAFAVIYIIQRMTSLAVLFGNLAFLLFLKYIETDNKKSLLFSLLLVFIATLFKENGILYLGVFMAYAVFFKEDTKSVLKLYLLSFLTLVLFYFICNNFFVKAFAIKDMNPWNRFLTEFRVLIFYLKNILIPVRENIFLFLYISPSKSLFSPLTTLFSAIALLFLFILPAFVIKKSKAFAFSIFSFFIFHFMESTFLPLETIFLHRNYAASFFILLSATILISKLRDKIKIIVYCLLFFNFLFVGFMHNTTWSFPDFYYQYNAKFFPDNPQLKMIKVSELRKKGNYEKAFFMLKQFATKLRYTFANREIARILLANSDYKTLTKLKPLLSNEDHLELYFLAKAYENLQNLKLAETFYLKSLEKNFMPSVFENYITFLYNNDLYDKVVFAVEQNKKKLDKSLILTKEYAVLTYLTYIECCYRINLTEHIEETESKIIKTLPHNKNLTNYLKILKLLHQKDYQKALFLLERLKLGSFETINLFIKNKKDIFIACCYYKLKQENKLRNYLDKHSINPIIYSSILRGLDKCY